MPWSFSGERHTEPASSSIVVDRSSTARHGGNFTWTGVHYKMKVASGFSPLQWLNGLTQHMLDLTDMILEMDGGFRRPGDSNPMFPVGGTDIRWRWDMDRKRIIFDFFKDGELLPWRWDELEPSAEFRFPSTAPDLSGVGHVGQFTFTYSLLSATAEVQSTAERSRAEWVPGMLAIKPQGTWKLNQQLQFGDEACRDFARLFQAGSASRLFLLCTPSNSTSLPLLQKLGTGSVAPGDLSADAVANAFQKFSEQLNCACSVEQRTSELLPSVVIQRIVAYAAASAGFKSLLVGDLEILPVLLQPTYVIVVLSAAAQVRLLTYGYIAEDHEQIWGDRPDQKRTAFALQIISPELGVNSSEVQTMHYAVQIARGASMVEHVASDVNNILHTMLNMKGFLHHDGASDDKSNL